MSYTGSTQTLNDPCLLEFKKGVFLFSYLVKSSYRDFCRFCVKKKKEKKSWVCGLGLLYFFIEGFSSRV